MGNTVKSSQKFIYLGIFVFFLIGTILLFSQRYHPHTKNEVKGVVSGEQIVESITPDEAFKMINSKNNDIVLIDVRTEEEFSKEHISNAKNTKNFASLDREKIYILYCRIDNRAENALEKMKNLGFSEIYHINGGIEAWKKDGYETTN